MSKRVKIESDERLLRVIAEKMGKDEIKKGILLELKGKELVEMINVYKKLAVKYGIDYSKFSVRMRTLVNGGFVSKIKPEGSGIGNRVFVELTEKGKKVAELLDK